MAQYPADMYYEEMPDHWQVYEVETDLTLSAWESEGEAHQEAARLDRHPGNTHRTIRHKFVAGPEIV